MAKTEFLREYKGEPKDVLKTALGTFKLNRNYMFYEGEISYLGKTASVSLDLSDDGTADTALRRLENLCLDLSCFDAQIREIAADELYGYVPDWYDDEISREEFKDALGVPFISVSSDGSIDAMLDGGEIFCDHGVLVWLDPEGRPLGADLVG